MSKRRTAVALGVGLVVLGLAAGVYTQLDLDEDGLDAIAEWRTGTSAWSPDTDADGLPDGFEQERGIDPRLQDTDLDDLPDRSELLEGTNPRVPDSDADGLDDGRERSLETNPRSSDTDRDEVADGVEQRIGTNPTAWDTDDDGVDDGTELLRGASPWIRDTDTDGLDDLTEARAGPADCDGDGIDRIAEGDDDADDLLDAGEQPDWVCDADVDGDGILDGREGARACVPAPDCDADGLEDPDELDTAFDRLDPDTYDTGLLDGVTYVFQEAGQPPSTDDDQDGIPDAWERSEGLLEWEHFDPEPGRRDLLVEFVRVEDPDSSRFGPGSMEASYERVARFFETSGDVSMSWIETTVGLEEVRRPPLIPSAEASYYRHVLRRAEASANPYVTTVVLNPQHDQSQVTHQGVAPIRSMLAAVDYGAHTTVTFRADGNTLTMSPIVESLIVAERSDLIGGRGITGGGRLSDGDMYLETASSQITWTPFWFARPPTQRFDDGRTLAYERASLVLDEAELADTIAHELGHTLGLCHTNLASCQANLSIEDRVPVGASTMDERRSSPDLAFLDSEWAHLRDYLTCPPHRPIGLIAEGANRSARIDAKYAITLENVLNVNTRECQDLSPIPGNLQPTRDPNTYRAPYDFERGDLDEPATLYHAPPEDQVPPTPTGGAGSTLLYAAASIVLSVAASTSVALVRS